MSIARGHRTIRRQRVFAARLTFAFSLTLAVGLLPACAGREDDGEGHGAHAAGGRAARVNVAPVRKGPLQVEWVLYGEVRAAMRAEIAAGVEGEVQRVFVREGDRVAAGEPLLRVDGALLRARVSAARAATARVEQEQAQAERELERYHRAGSEIVAGVEIERAASRSQVLSAERASQRAVLREASAEFRRHVTKAPFAGVVTARRVDPGDWVTGGTPAFEVVADHANEVVVGAPRDVASRVRVGDAAEVRDGHRQLPATVVGVVTALDPVSRTAPLRLALEVEEAGPPAGATVDVAFTVSLDAPGAFVVPRDALVETPRGYKVWTLSSLEAEAAEAVTVEVLHRGVADVMLTGEGLVATTQVVVRGNEQLRPGQRVIAEAL